MMVIESVWLKLNSWRQASELGATVEITIKWLSHSVESGSWPKPGGEKPDDLAWTTG